MEDKARKASKSSNSKSSNKPSRLSKVRKLIEDVGGIAAGLVAIAEGVQRLIKGVL